MPSAAASVAATVMNDAIGRDGRPLSLKIWNGRKAQKKRNHRNHRNSGDAAVGLAVRFRVVERKRHEKTREEPKVIFCGETLFGLAVEKEGKQPSNKDEDRQD